MTSKRLKIVIGLLLANAAASVGYVVALKKGVSIPIVRAETRTWLEILPDVILVVVLSVLAAYSMSRRRTWGFAIGMVAAGAYMGGGGPTVARFILQITQAGATAAGVPAPRPDVPFVSIYFTLFGIGLGIYLWSRRHVFAVGV